MSQLLNTTSNVLMGTHANGGIRKGAPLKYHHVIRLLKVQLVSAPLERVSPVLTYCIECFSNNYCLMAIQGLIARAITIR